MGNGCCSQCSLAALLFQPLLLRRQPAGVVSNVIVAQGVTLGPVKERARW